MSRRDSAAFEAYVNRAVDDERDYDEIAAEAEERLLERADQIRKGES